MKWSSASARATAALLMVLLAGLVFNADGAFFKLSTHRDTFRQSSVFGILACGMTVVILSGGIDLAVGSVLALVAVCFSITSIWWGWPPVLAAILCLFIGALCGAVSGTLIARFRIQPFIATLAMMAFARGCAKMISGGMKVSTAVKNTDGSYRYLEVPAFFRFIDSRTFGGNLAVVTIVLAVCLALTWAMMERHRVGRELYAIGGNEEAARLAGVPVTGAKIAAYLYSGLLAAVAGICQAAQEQQGDPEAGAGYELTAIAIVVIGGTSLSGGRGAVLLTLLGVFTIGYMEKILSMNAVPEAGRLMLTGIIVVSAVLAQRRRPGKA